MTKKANNNLMDLLHYEEHCQQVKGRDLSSLFSSGEAHLECSSGSGLLRQTWTYWSGIHAKMMKGLKHLSHKEEFERTEVASPQEKKAWRGENLNNVYKYLM